MTKWIAGGLAALAVLFFSLDRANVEARITTLESSGSPATRERLARVETSLEYITSLLEEIKARLDDNHRDDQRHPTEGRRLQ
jgi:hypothetical protein